jgi:putative autotransporter adhesin-like protein
VSLSGTARAARLTSTGGSDLNAGRFTAGEATVNSSGGSDLVVAVRDKISGHASGGSDVAYSGQPSTVDIDTSGGSDVTRR